MRRCKCSKILTPTDTKILQMFHLECLRQLLLDLLRLQDIRNLLARQRHLLHLHRLECLAKCQTSPGLSLIFLLMQVIRWKVFFRTIGTTTNTVLEVAKTRQQRLQDSKQKMGIQFTQDQLFNLLLCKLSLASVFRNECMQGVVKKMVEQSQHPHEALLQQLKNQSLLQAFDG